jgi:hypothetical protein
MFTINDLLKACQEQVAKGNGDKGILISRDDEGNGYHSLGYLFSEDIWEFTDPEEMHMTEEEFNEYIILG